MRSGAREFPAARTDSTAIASKTDLISPGKHKPTSIAAKMKLKTHKNTITNTGKKKIKEK